MVPRCLVEVMEVCRYKTLRFLCLCLGSHMMGNDRLMMTRKRDAIVHSGETNLMENSDEID